MTLRNQRIAIQSRYFYALAVRSKKLGIPAMDRGMWMLMHVGDDREDIGYRYEQAQAYLRPIAGEMVVFQISKSDPGAVRVLGLFGCRKQPPLSDIAKADIDIQAGFWRRAGYVDKFKTAMKARPAHKPPPPVEKRFSWFGG